MLATEENIDYEQFEHTEIVFRAGSHPDPRVPLQAAIDWISDYINVTDGSVPEITGISVASEHDSNWSTTYSLRLTYNN